MHTTLLPFLKLRSPRPDSIKFITDFSRRTGDLEVLSKPDIHLLALCYELEIERNSGDWRLRRTPAQKGLNGKPPAPEDEHVPTPVAGEDEKEPQVEVTPEAQEIPTEIELPAEATPAEPEVDAVDQQLQTGDVEGGDIESKLQDLNLEESLQETIQEDGATGEPAQDASDDDDDSDGWITPSNLKKHQAKDSTVSAPSEAIQETLQAALLTSDFAMQNVALRINLKYVSLCTPPLLISLPFYLLGV